MTSTSMHRFLVVTGLPLSPTIALAQTSRAKPASSTAKRVAAKSAPAKAPLVEFEMMTWPEVKQALAEGKTAALF
jgi:hypothetical protein